eukprot:s5692_g6.t1
MFLALDSSDTLRFQRATILGSVGTQPTGSEQSSLEFAFLVAVRHEIGRGSGCMLSMARDQFSPGFDTSHASCPPPSSLVAHIARSSRLRSSVDLTQLGPEVVQSTRNIASVQVHF